MAKTEIPKKTNGDTTVAPVQSAATATFLLSETSVATAVPSADTPKPTRKPSIVSNENRANLVPIQS